MIEKEKISDLELCQSISMEAGEHYRKALDVISIYPDYAKSQFRQVIEHLTSTLASHFNIPPQIDLFDAIKALHQNKLIDDELSSQLHHIRKQGNAAVHAKSTTRINKEGGAVYTNSSENSNDADSARGTRLELIEAFKKIFSIINNRNPPTILIAEFNDITSQIILWKAVSTFDFNSKMSAGLILEAQALAPIRKDRLIISNVEDTHHQTTLRMAAELYWSACEISARTDSLNSNDLHRLGGNEEPIFKLANPEALYRYGRLTFEENKGEKSQIRGIKALEACAKRKYTGAYILYAEMLRDESKFNESLNILEQALHAGETAAYAALGLIYQDENVPFYSPEKSKQFLEDGVAKDDSHSKFLLGKMLYEGKITHQDKERGLQLLKSSAAEGSINAKNYLNFEIDDRLFNAISDRFKLMGHIFKAMTDQSRLINKQGRNELCACGSTKKYKKCCGK
ncbi:DUF4145 domain-containing protein [Vogesella mureinivorans]|uniref:DUF4145 domain-containing protein n=1 Tax=Vogesella mureinivorans TaxID=657276 RepID=UPI00197D416E|nr:DUF4145 domain-containing protein [Vogesella mureinivorans]